ncbi:MAG: PadR family transcriptional regulator [Dehalococcoidia bacterium]
MSLRCALLAQLNVEELSGYELTRRLAGSPGLFWQARSQQIYPELVRLEEQGLLTSRVVEQASRPDKRLYAITEIGRDRLGEWVLSESPPSFSKDDFLMKVWSYGMVDPAAARRALSLHRTHHELRLARFEEAARAQPGAAEDLDARQFGEQLTLHAGLHVERSLLAWCAMADEWLRDREAATRPSATETEQTA